MIGAGQKPHIKVCQPPIIKRQGNAHGRSWPHWTVLYRRHGDPPKQSKFRRTEANIKGGRERKKHIDDRNKIPYI